jgi:hypothetical protein
VFVRLTIQPVERFSHHVQLRMAVPLEDSSITLAKHQCDEVVSYTTCAEPRRERVTKLI